MQGSSPSSWAESRTVENRTASFDNNSSYSAQNFSRPQREEFKVHVKSLPIDMTKESLGALFRSCGNVVSTHILDPREGWNTTVGFVGFSSEEEVNNAIQNMNGITLADNRLMVQRAIPRDRNAGTPRRGQENQRNAGFQRSTGYQNGQPPFQGHRTEQHEQTFGRGADFVQRNNYIQQPAAVPNWKHNISVNVEQAVFNPRGPGRGIPLQTHSPNPAPGRRNNYMNGVGNDHSSNVQDQVNSASWTNQGPQQWDQSGPVNNQSGQSPHSTVPQDQYTQMDQQGQFQNGPVNSATWTNQGPQHWDQSGPIDDQSGQFPHSTITQDPYTQMDQQGQLQNGPANSAPWTNQGPQQWDHSGSVDSQSGQFPHSTMPQDQYPQMDQQGQLQNGPVNSGSLTNQGPQQWDQSGPVDNQSGQFLHSTLPQDQYDQMDQQGHLQNGPVNSASWSNQGPQQWDQSSSVDSQSGHFPHSTMPQDQYTQMNQQGQFQNGPVNSASWTNQGPQQWDQSGPVDNQSGQFPHSTMPPDQYHQMDQQGQFQHGQMNPASFSNQMPQQWDQTSPIDNQHSTMSGRLPYNTTPQEPYTQMNHHAQNGSKGCYKCGADGHFARECPNQEHRTKGGQSCYKCGEVGHFSRECPNQAEHGGNQKRRGDQSCFKCGESGHFSRECSSSGVLDKSCRNCGEEGHFAKECPAGGNFSSPGQRGDQGCFKCGETGHFARECQSEGPEKRVAPVTYIPPELPDNIDELFMDAPHSGLNFDKYDDIPVQVTGKDPVNPIKSFEEAGILEQCSANIKKAKFTKPTPIQKYAIPIALEGRDLMACAQTGSGKTVAFLVPVLTSMIKQGHLSGGFLSGETQTPSALCIAPTRELAVQIYKEVCKFANETVVTAAVCYGGVSVQFQLDKLRRGCHVLVATPGRLEDFVNRNRVSLSNVRYLILDEADRMLDMGFESKVRKLVETCGMPDKTNRQTLMFSATFPDEIQRLAADFLKDDYLFVAVGRIGGSNLDISQSVMSVPGDDKQQKLFDILLESGTDRTLIFVELKRVADFLACLLSQNNFPTTSISGDRTQQEREAALRDFRSGRAPVLVATSVAARGLDIPDVKHVINFDLPQDIEEYVHRIGRTGRIGNKGTATSFFQPGKDERLARSLVKVLSEAYQEVPEWLEHVAEEAIGSSYGPAGGKFASKDRREREHSRASGSADVMEPVNRGMARLDVNAARNQPHAVQNNSNNEDEEEWD